MIALRPMSEFSKIMPLTSASSSKIELRMMLFWTMQPDPIEANGQITDS